VNDWLPEHQRHLLYTFAHIDSVIDQLGNVLHDFLEAGPLDSADDLIGKIEVPASRRETGTGHAAPEESGLSVLKDKGFRPRRAAVLPPRSE
jgi:hypothetical protein